MPLHFAVWAGQRAAAAALVRAKCRLNATGHSDRCVGVGAGVCVGGSITPSKQRETRRCRALSNHSGQRTVAVCPADRGHPAHLPPQRTHTHTHILPPSRPATPPPRSLGLVTCNAGSTALHIAAMRGSTDMATFLLETWATVSAGRQ